MAMFEKVTEHVIESAGPLTLHAVADINSAERYKTLCVVERRKNFWFWKSPSMVPTFVTLKDLLVREGDLAAKEKEFTLLKDLSDNPKLSVGGSLKVSEKLAKKIAAQADISLDGHDQMNLDIKLGDVIKSEVPYETLRNALHNNPIDTAHPLYISAARNSPRTTLCVVMESLSTKGDAEISKDEELKINTSLSANVIKIDVKAKGSVESKCTRSYAIPPETVLAYSCVEMDVDPDGMVELHVTDDRLDHSTATLELPESPFKTIKREFEPLKDLDNVDQIRKEVKSLLAGVSETDFRVMHILLYYANIGSSTNMPVSKLKHLLGTDITYLWKPFMRLLGFSVEENVASGGSMYVVYPKEVEHGVLKGCLLLIDSILDCYSGKFKSVPEISVKHSHILMKVIKREFEGKGNTVNNSEFKQMIKDDPKTMEFLKVCGFKQSLGGALTFTGKNSNHLLDVYVIMYFLAGGVDAHCSII